MQLSQFALISSNNFMFLDLVRTKLSSQSLVGEKWQNLIWCGPHTASFVSSRVKLVNCTLFGGGWDNVEINFEVDVGKSSERFSLPSLKAAEMCYQLGRASVVFGPTGQCSHTGA